MSTAFNRLTTQLESWKKNAPGHWGVWVEDLHSHEVWNWNSEQTFFAASVIKVPIMVAVYREAWRGRFALGDTIRLTPEVQVGGAGVLQHMTPGLDITIQDLTTLMIIQSDNTATNMILDLVGKEVVNEVMQDLGMKHSHLYNPLMIVPADREGINIITAEDVANCYRKIALGEAVSYHASLQMINILKKQQIQDCFPSRLPRPDDAVVGTIPSYELAHKTGMVTRVLHDTGILYKGSNAIMIIALSEDCSYDEAKEHLGQLALQVYTTYENH